LHRSNLLVLYSPYRNDRRETTCEIHAPLEVDVYPGIGRNVNYQHYFEKLMKIPCFGRRVGLDDPQRSLPTPTIL